MAWAERESLVEMLGLWAGLGLGLAACGERPFPSKFYYCTVGKQQLAGLVGQSLARETLDAPIKVCKKDSSLGLSAFGSIAGVDCTLTIDTGSDITIVWPDVLLKSGTRLEPLAGHIRTVTGETTPIRAKGQLELSIGNLTAAHEIWVADIIYDECIIGMDFLQKYKCLVDLKEGVLQIENEEILLVRDRSPTAPTCCRVVSESTVTLPPLSEVVIPARLRETNPRFTWG